MIGNTLIDNSENLKLADTIKEILARCGNIVKDINKKENAKKLIQSFINKRLLLLENL